MTASGGPGQAAHGAGAEMTIAACSPRCSAWGMWHIQLGHVQARARLSWSFSSSTLDDKVFCFDVPQHWS